MKKCPRCGADGPFTKNRSTRDGLSVYCRTCKAEVAKKSSIKHADKIREKQAEYRKRPGAQQKAVLRVKEWRADNHEHVLAYAADYYAKTYPLRRQERREYYANNKEAARNRHRRNYEKTRETRLAKIAEWKQANEFRVIAMSATRRALANSARGMSTPEQIEARVEVFGGMCAYCAIAPFEHIDHVIPLSKHGTNWPANLRPACAPCNLRKNAQTWRKVIFP